MIRIVHVALQLETGGLERLLVEFARLADRTRFSLAFVSLGSGGPIADEIGALGWPVTVLGAPPGVRLSLVGRLASLFREHRADVVHSHNTKPLLYAAPAAKLAGVQALIHSRHGQRHGAAARHDFLFKMASRSVDRMVCVSSEAAARCRAEGLRASSIRTIWNGIDLEKFACAEKRGRGAVFVGRLTPEKSVGTLLHATQLALRQDRDFTLRIAGAGVCDAELKALANELGLAQHVEFVGETREVPALLRSAEMFVLPSRTEGLSLAILEAMASGLPVIATNVGGNPEAVVDGHTGMLVPPGDAQALAAAMLRVRGDTQLAQQMSTAARRRVETHFSVKSMVAKYEALYEEVLSERMAQAA